MLKCYDLKCEGLTEPLGIDIKKPRFSWKIKSDKKNTVQTEYEIIIDSMWETKICSDNSLFIEYDGLPLMPKTKYNYKVRVKDNYGRISDYETGSFVTGLFGEKPKAKWISPKKTEDKVPIFSKTFTWEKISTAYVFASAYGLYEIYINGKKVGDSYLSPGFTSYLKRLQYQMYDVKDYLKKGENKIEIILGRGWCCGPFTYSKGTKNIYKEVPAVMLQLEINGEIAVITNESWKKHDSPILFSEIYNGEIYDSRLVNKYENKEAVQISDYSYDNLVWNSGVPVKVIEEIKPQRIIKTPKGETVIDFGQNIAGWVQLEVSGKTGDKIRYTHAEVLDKDGNFYSQNMRSAKNEITFILNGEASQLFRPHFTFQGFRYIRIEECSFPITEENFTAQVLSSDINVSGKFESSNELLNRFFLNVLWGQKGNFVDVPTDCPQRDERLGWTGDAQVFISTAFKNSDAYAFFRKWLYDMAADQNDDGMITWYIPKLKEIYSSSAWGDASVICPWELYKFYGDKKLLAEHYPMMKKWISYIRGIGDNEYLWNDGFHFGDWLSLDAKNGSNDGGTDKFYIATVFYAYSTSIVAKVAKILGYTEEARGFTELYNNIVKEFKKAFLDKNEFPICKTHTAYVLLLFMGLTDNGKAVAEELNNMIIECGTRLNTGFVGTPYLCYVLTKYNYLDTAYSLLLRTEYPSWLYPVTKGATTVWERWNGIKPDGNLHESSMNSFNHYAYGCIADWMYSVVCGITPDESSTAYKKSVIVPHPDKRLDFCGSEFETPYGIIASKWEYVGTKTKFIFRIPENTTSKIILPNGEEHSVGSGIHEFEI